MGLLDRILPKRRWSRFIEAFKSNRGDPWSTFSTYDFDFTRYSKKFAYYYEKFPQVKSATIGIAGQVRGEGTYLLPAKRKTGDGIPEANQRSYKAMELCERLNKNIDVDQLIFDTALRMVKYGTCWWEKAVSPVFDVQMVNPKIQPLLKPIYKQGTIEVIGWTTSPNDPKKGLTWSNEEITLVPWDVDVYYPYGTSLLSGIDRELNALDQLLDTAVEYARKNAYPTHYVQVGDDEYQPGDTTLQGFKSSVDNNNAGGTVITSAPVSGFTSGGGGDASTVPELMRFSVDQVSDGLIAPPLSKLYDSTEASAKVTQKWVRQVLIIPIQHIIKTRIEEDIYWPFLRSLGYSIRNVPSLNFDIPESYMVDEIAALTGLVNSNIMTPEQCSEELGFDYDEEYFKQKAEATARLAKEEKPEENPERQEQETT